MTALLAIRNSALSFNAADPVTPSGAGGSSKTQRLLTATSCRCGMQDDAYGGTLAEALRIAPRL